MAERTRFPPPGSWRHIWDPPPSVALPAPPSEGAGLVFALGARLVVGPARGVGDQARSSWLTTPSRRRWRRPQRPLDLVEVRRRIDLVRRPACCSAERPMRPIELVDGGGSGVELRPMVGHRPFYRRTAAGRGQVADAARQPRPVPVWAVGARPLDWWVHDGDRAEPTRPAGRTGDLAPLLPRPDVGGDEPVAAVRAILADVRDAGRRRRARAHRALRRRRARRPAGAPAAARQAALGALPPALVEALTAARTRSEAFHETQLRPDHTYERDGIVVRGPHRCRSTGPASTCPAGGPPTRRPC